MGQKWSNALNVKSGKTRASLVNNPDGRMGWGVGAKSASASTFTSITGGTGKMWKNTGAMRNAIGLLMVSNKSNAASVGGGNLRTSFTETTGLKMDYTGRAKSAQKKQFASIMSNGWLCGIEKVYRHYRGFGSITAQTNSPLFWNKLWRYYEQKKTWWI